MQIARFDLKLVSIGNSFGVRLSRPLLKRYGIENAVVAETRPDGILLRGVKTQKTTLAQTFAEMAQAQEDWSDLAHTAADGLNQLDW